MRLAYGKERIMVKSAYFTRFGAQDYQIFQLQDKSYVMVRLVHNIHIRRLLHHNRFGL